MRSQTVRHDCVTHTHKASRGFPGAQTVKNLPANAGEAGDAVSIPGLGRCPAKGNGHLLQYPCLDNSIDRGAWWATVHGDLSLEYISQYGLHSRWI